MKSASRAGGRRFLLASGIGICLALSLAGHFLDFFNLSRTAKITALLVLSPAASVIVFLAFRLFTGDSERIRGWQWIFVSLVLSGLILCINYQSPTYPSENTLTLHVTGEKNSASSGKRVVLLGIKTSKGNVLAPQELNLSGNWQQAGDLLLAAGSTPATITYQGMMWDSPTLSLAGAPDSGKVEILWNDHSQIVDLYSPQETTVYYAPPADQRAAPNILWRSLILAFLLADWLSLAAILLGGYLLLKEPQRHARLIGWAILCTLLLASFLWIPRLIDNFNFRYTPESSPNIDFNAFYMAGKAYIAGLNPYILNPALSSNPEPDYIYYKYPPTFLPFFALFAKGSFENARTVWFSLNLGVFALAFTLLVLGSPKPQHKSLILLGLVLTLTSHPLLFHIRQGQIDLLVSSLVIISHLSYRSQKKWPSALLLATAILLKVNPLLMLITYFCFLGDVRYLLRVAACGCVLILISLLFVPLSLYLYYPGQVLTAATAGSDWYKNQSLIRLVSYAGWLPQLVTMAGILGFALFCWFVGSRKRRLSSSSDGSQFPLPTLFVGNVFVLLLFSGLSWHMAYVWVILPVTSSFLEISAQSNPWEVGIAVAGITLLNAEVFALPFYDSLNILGASIFLLLILIRSFPARGNTTPLTP